MNWMDKQVGLETHSGEEADEGGGVNFFFEESRSGGIFYFQLSAEGDSREKVKPDRGDRAVFESEPDREGSF